MLCLYIETLVHSTLYVLMLLVNPNNNDSISKIFKKVEEIMKQIYTEIKLGRILEILGYSLWLFFKMILIVYETNVLVYNILVRLSLFLFTFSYTI